MATDSEIVNFAADRFVNVYGESEYVDFVQALRRAASHLQAIEETVFRAELEMRRG